MRLFRKSKESQSPALLGVDIGTSGIKIVELQTEKNRLQLRRYGYSEPAKNGLMTTSLLDEPVRAAAIIRQVMKDSDMQATRVIASLPSASVFQALITLPVPKTAKEDLKALIEAQARKLVPLPLEEMILDSNVLDKELLPKPEIIKKGDKDKATDEQAGTDIVPVENTKKYLRVLLTGAPKSLVAKYVEVFKQAKLELVSLETEAFAIIRTLVGKDKSRVMIVDMGAERTNIVVVDKGVPYLTRGIKSGGNAITQALAGSMNVSVEEAEAMKRDLAYRAMAGLPPALEAAIKPIVHEIRYALQLYADQTFHDNSTVEKIVITGGSSQVSGLVPYLTTELNMNVYHGDPWARVATPEEARPVLNEVGSRLAVAIGLAMRTKDDTV